MKLKVLILITESYIKNIELKEKIIVLYNFKKVKNCLISRNCFNKEIFDFENGKLNDLIQINDENLCAMYIQNKNFIIINGEDCNIYIIDINKKQICKTKKEHESDILTINKIKFNYKEECLLSLDYYGIIKLWNI